jgi:hypothetical protein
MRCFAAGPSYKPIEVKNETLDFEALDLGHLDQQKRSFLNQIFAAELVRAESGLADNPVFYVTESNVVRKPLRMVRMNGDSWIIETLPSRPFRQLQ